MVGYTGTYEPGQCDAMLIMSGTGNGHGYGDGWGDGDGNGWGDGIAETLLYPTIYGYGSGKGIDAERETLDIFRGRRFPER